MPKPNLNRAATSVVMELKLSTDGGDTRDDSLVAIREAVMNAFKAEADRQGLRKGLTWHVRIMTVAGFDRFARRLFGKHLEP